MKEVGRELGLKKHNLMTRIGTLVNVVVVIGGLVFVRMQLDPCYGLELRLGCN